MPRTFAAAVLLVASTLAPALPAADETRSLLAAGDSLPRAQLEALLPKALRAPVVTITDKPQPPPSGDPHDYVSYARYWWPDPTKPDGKPFVRRDGQHNEAQVAAGDRKKIDRLVDSVTVLALGWHRLGREDCARRAGGWLRTWFVNPATRMNPSLDYAQVRLGHNGGRGSPAGIIDTRTFAELVAVLPALEASPALTSAETAAVRRWFADYFHWLETAPMALAERRAENNHGSWFLVQASAIALYLGEKESARRLAEEGRERIAAQFAPDGSQPAELARADGLGYSAFNLEALLRLVPLARQAGVELWHHTATNGASLKAGLDYLRPHNDAPEKWPHRQNEKLPPGFLTPLLQAAEALEKR
jgi:hypothetical protein